MSLPPAPKDVSAHPKAGAVTEPVNKAEKDADVERKIKFYGIIQAFRNSRMPSNAQIDKTLQYMADHPLVPNAKLSPDGQRLFQDFRDILETARTIVRTKNGDEMLQDFVWHTRDLSLENTGAKKNLEEALPVNREKANQDGQDAVKHLRTLLSLVLTNSEARKLLSDLSLIGRDILSHGLVKASNGVAPDPDRMKDVDATAPHDQFVTEGGRRVGPDETPVLETDVPAVGTLAAHPKDDDVQVRTREGEIKSGNQIIREGKQKAADTADTFGREAADTVADAREKAPAPANDPNASAPDQARQVKAQAETLASSEHPAGEPEKKGFMNRLKGYRDGVLDRVPQEQKDKSGEYRERAQDKTNRGREWFAEEYFPEERRDQFIFRLKKVIIECQKHSDYQESIRWLLGYIKEYAGHSKTVLREGQSSAKAVREDGGFKLATRELRTLLERFANNKSLDGVIKSLDDLIRDAKEDDELRGWLKEVDTYTHKVLLDAGYVLEPACDDRARELRESGRQFYDVKYKSHFDRFFDETTIWFKGMSEDPLNTRFGQDWARLTKDLLFDSEGSLKFKKDLWNDIRKTVLPTIVDRVGYIPIPRIEYTDDMLDLVVENLTLSGRNLFPNFVSLDAHNHFSFSPYSAISDADKNPNGGHHEFKLTLAQMQADMRDVAFYFRKKSGFPKIQDSGLADVVLGGSGITIHTTLLSSPPRDRRSVFRVKDVHVSVDSLKFSIRDSKHDLLYKTLRPLATGLVKKQIQRAITDSVRTGLEYIDGQLVAVRDRMEAAKTSDEETRLQALRELFKSRKEEAEQAKAEAASEKHARHAHFKVVANKRDSLLAKEGYPGGWVNRTAERDAAATTGENWHSEAFDIVSTSESTTPATHLPTAASTTTPATGGTPQPIAVA